MFFLKLLVIDIGGRKRYQKNVFLLWFALCPMFYKRAIPHRCEMWASLCWQLFFRSNLIGKLESHYNGSSLLSRGQDKTLSCYFHPKKTNIYWSLNCKLATFYIINLKKRLSHLRVKLLQLQLLYFYYSKCTASKKIPLFFVMKLNVSSLQRRTVAMLVY